MVWLLALIAVTTGMLLPIQASINSRLRPYVGGPIPASLVSVGVSTATIVLLALASRTPVPSNSKLSGSPWWIWTGGVLGVVVVLVSLGLVNRLGAAFLFALMIVGQMLASLAIDHFGLFGVSAQAISPLRFLGVLLLLTGVVLIRFF